MKWKVCYTLLGYCLLAVINISAERAIKTIHTFSPWCSFMIFGAAHLAGSSIFLTQMFKLTNHIVIGRVFCQCQIDYCHLASKELQHVILFALLVALATTTHSRVDTLFGSCSILFILFILGLFVVFNIG